MFYKSAFNHAQHITTTNRCRTYIHFSGASQTPRRRVKAQIASYFWEIIFILPKRSDPSITYLCFTNLHTTTHNISQQLIDAHLYPLLRGVSNSSPPCKRPNRKLFLGNNFYPPKTQWPIDNLSMFYKSAYHHAPHITTTNRCRTYIHFSGASQTPRRRVNANIANYFEK